MFTIVPKLELLFNEKEIPYKCFQDNKGRVITEHVKQAWISRQINHSKISQSKKSAGMNESDFNTHYAKPDEVLHTLVAKGENTQINYQYPVYLSKNEWIKAGTFPSDYEFLTFNPFYLIGMSVPPLMTAKIANEVYNQWLF